MKSSFRIAQIAGIDIKVHASFFLILVLGGAQWGVPYGARGALFGALLMIVLFACVVLHELGHSLVSKRLGLPVREIILLPIGGISRMEKNPSTPVQELLVSAAGPLVNFAIAGLIFFATGERLGSLTGESLVKGPGAPGLPTALVWLLGANVVLGLFNLLPAFPLDGGRVFRAVLWLFFDYATATRVASAVGQFLAIVLGFMGIMSGNFILALVAVFIFLGAGQERAEEQARHVLGTLKVGDAYNKYAITLAPGDRVSRVVDYILTSYQPDFAVMQGSTLLGIVTRADVLQALSKDLDDPYVAGIMKRDVLRVDASLYLDEVRRQLAEKGERVAAVYRGETYLGLVSREDIAEALLVVAFREGQETRRAAAAR
jgi:Zn-dependent protease/predicted transcriptional regulator